MRQKTEFLLSDKHVANRLNVHRGTIWHWLKNDPTFPKPFKLSERCTRWRLSEIEAWENAKQRGAAA